MHPSLNPGTRAAEVASIRGQVSEDKAKSLSGERIFQAVSRCGSVVGEELNTTAVLGVVAAYAEDLGLQLSPQELQVAVNDKTGSGPPLSRGGVPGGRPLPTSPGRARAPRPAPRAVVGTAATKLTGMVFAAGKA